MGSPPGESGILRHSLRSYRRCSFMKTEGKLGKHSIVLFIKKILPSATATIQTVPEGYLALGYFFPKQWSLFPMIVVTKNYTEKFIEVFGVMKFLIMPPNCMKFEMILWLELHGTLHEFSTAVKMKEGNNETVI